MAGTARRAPGFRDSWRGQLGRRKLPGARLHGAGARCGSRARRQGGANIAKGSSDRNIVKGIALVVVAYFLVNVLGTAFNVTGTTLLVLNIAPTFLAIGLLLRYLDVI